MVWDQSLRESTTVCSVESIIRDMPDFRHWSSKVTTTVDSDMQFAVVVLLSFEELVVLQDFEVSQLHKKTVNNFTTWVQYFCRYTAAAPCGLHPKLLLKTVKAFIEVEHPAKDVTLYQELSGSRQKQKSAATDKREVAKGKCRFSKRPSMLALLWWSVYV